MKKSEQLIKQASEIFEELKSFDLHERIDLINQLRIVLHRYSPFNNEPVDCVQWVKKESVITNDYNPNTVAPPEMRLLELSIKADGFTQPIVAYAENSNYIVVDGFHRQRVARKKQMEKRFYGYLPIVAIRQNRNALVDRMAATIRHNRARGVHGVRPMTDIVIHLLQAGMSEESVAKELGMDIDEVLRFKQVSGLPELFKSHSYSNSWD